jgi:glycine rich protein
MNTWTRSARLPAFLGTIAVAVLAGSVLGASGSAPPATFYGCLTSGGTLIQVVTTPAKPPTCPSGSTAVTWNQPGGGGGFSGVTEFTNTGAFVAPAGVTHLLVEAWGGGGGGGSEPSPACATGGGGGSGGYVRGVVAVTPGQSYNVTIGPGGAPSTSGGASSFSSQDTALISAGGGGGASVSTSGAGGQGNAAGGILRVGNPGANGSPDFMCGGFGSGPGGTSVQGSVAIPGRSSGGDGGSFFNTNTPQPGNPGEVILTW